MPEQIISSSGTQYGLIINADGSIPVSGVFGNTTVNAGSSAYIYGISGGTWMPLAVVSGTEAVLRVSSSVSVTTGSEVYIKAGSVQTYNPVGIGSVSIVNARYDLGSYLLVAGSISSMPSISVSTGSEVYVKGGSIQPYNPIGVGSVLVVSSAGSIGVYGNLSTTAGSEFYVKGGSVQTYSPIGVGSVRIAEQGVTFGVSGIVNQGTSPWVTVGSVNAISVDVLPTNANRLNGRYDFDYVGSVVGSINYYTSAGSFVKVLTYDLGSSVKSISAWTAI